MSTRANAQAFAIALLLSPVVLALAGCGGGGSGPSQAPVITNVQIRALTPEKANTEVRYSIVVSISDSQGDLVGGHVELRADGQQSDEVTIEASDATGPNTAVVPSVLTTNPLPPGRYSASVVATDAGGHESAPIPFFITIQAELPRGMEPVPAPGRGRWIEGLDRGR